ncbi:MAG: 30S ribosomal protein S6 [Opitutae bacterium]|nr:30S ribosomal protein S6 [Opitutae bacterium]MCD8299396.1 30S ribosomal protein S6 [Opitutae bacterium]
MNDLKKYRLNMIFDVRSVTAEAQIEKIQKLLSSLGATLEETKDLGVKDFVRVTDRRMPNAHYVQFYVSAGTTLPVVFREKLRLDRTIKRILFQAC